jgi:MoaA/NifB/PqqE/SkfB family radical SAM enzyme
MYKVSDIKEVHLEITQRCNAACPMCDRNHNGGEVNRHIRGAEQELSLEDIMVIFPPDFIKQLKTMYMCGNLGDPISARDTLEVFRYFRECNPNIWLSMNTNAGARDAEWWADVAKAIGKMGCVIFSVDGLENTNHLYRQNVRWEFVERNMKAFINAGGRARWDY